MFSLVLLFLLIGKCIGHTSGPPYGTCKSFSTGHPSYGINADCTAKVSFLKQGLAVTCYTPGETYTGMHVMLHAHTESLVICVITPRSMQFK